MEIKVGPMSTLSTSKSWIQLRMDDPTLGGVTVHRGDGDIISLGKELIARSAQIASKIVRFEPQLEALEKELSLWSSQRAEVIKEVFLVLKGDHFLFLVLLKGKQYDNALEDDLTDLDMKVAQDPDYDLIKLSVLALPAFADDVIHSFLPSHLKPREASEDAGRVEPSGAGES